MKRKKPFIALIILFSFISISGCQNEEETLYNRKIVVDGQSLPFYESSLTYNSESEQMIESKLHVLFNTSLGALLEKGDYIIVNHDGDDLTKNFSKEDIPTTEDISEITKEIKENGYLVVEKNNYRITSIEKEINALFKGEMKVWPEVLDKILEDNKDAYKNKDYEAINYYLMKNKIIVWKPLALEE